MYAIRSYYERPWGLYLFVVIVVALGVTWWMGKLDSWLPEKVTAAHVLCRDCSENLAASEGAGTEVPPAQ